MARTTDDDRTARRERRGPARVGWREALRRTARAFTRDNLSDWAAALTYYAVLSIFPALLALVSILGLVGSSATRPLLDNLGSLAPGPARDMIESMLGQLEGSQGGAGVALAVGVLLALWSASGYVAGFMRAANAVYGVGEGRPAWKTLPVRLGITVVVMVLLAGIALGVVFTGALADRAGDLLGLGSTVVTVWNIAKWPVMVVLFGLVLAVLYWGAPNVRHGFRWITPGALLAVLIWILASAAFAVYVANFASYNKTYGSLAGVIVFLVWLWISNLAVLLGLEFDTERESEKPSGDGSTEEGPKAEPRDTRKL